MGKWEADFDSCSQLCMSLSSGREPIFSSCYYCGVVLDLFSSLPFVIELSYAALGLASERLRMPQQGYALHIVTRQKYLFPNLFCDETSKCLRSHSLT